VQLARTTADPWEHNLTGYESKVSTLQLGEHQYRIRSLSDRQQFSDPFDLAKAAGIGSSNWSLFGQIWPSGKLLASAMCDFDVEGKRILELGCGLGLATLVLTRRGADITATDHHPMAGEFLAHNAGLNDLTIPLFHGLRWDRIDGVLGLFDLIIASDVLYERDHPELLAQVCSSHLQKNAEVLITDPGRHNHAAFSRALHVQGFAMTQRRAAFDADDLPPYQGRLLHYRRDGAKTAA
jgi:predicted nicotinamide N-methyase